MAAASVPDAADRLELRDAGDRHDVGAGVEDE